MAMAMAMQCTWTLVSTHSLNRLTLNDADSLSRMRNEKKNYREPGQVYFELVW